MVQLTVEQLQATPRPRMTIPGLSIPEEWRSDELPTGIRPYQYIDAAFALLRKRCIIAEYPGAGKKLIAIMAALKSFELMKARSYLIVSLGTDVDQWEEDLHMLTQGCTVQVYRGAPRIRANMREQEVDFRITTYQTAAADLEYLYGLHQGVILDEVSYLKNPDTDAHAHLRGMCSPTLVECSTALAQLWSTEQTKKQDRNPYHQLRPFPGFSPSGPPARYVWGLSATPYETSPLDVFSLFWVIHGSASPLGMNPDRYKRDYCVVNRFNIFTYVQTRQGRRRKRIRVEKVAGTQPEMLPVLSDRIKEHYIRHPWEVVSPFLPPIEVIPDWLEMGARQRQRYQEISDGRVVADYVFQERGRRIHEKQVTYALKQFYQLRCCDGLQSLPGQRNTDSIKKQRAMQWLTGELGGEKVLLYSRFHQPLNELQTKLDEHGILWQRIDGIRSDDENTLARRTFMTSEHPMVMLMTGKAGYALNLQAARYGIAYNTLFNPKKLEQLYGRNRRPGIDNVVWYHLLCRDTAEEAQWTILHEREEEFRALFGSEESFFDSLPPSLQREIVEYGLGSS